LRIECDRRSTTNVVLAVHSNVQRLGISLRESPVFDRHGELVNEISQMRVIETHKLVDVCKAERPAT